MSTKISTLGLGQVLIQEQLIYSLAFATTKKKKKEIRNPFLNAVFPQGIPRKKKHEDDDGKNIPDPYRISRVIIPLSLFFRDERLNIN